jgi:hypothetical protein
MKIDRITISRLHSLGNYNNVRLDISLTPDIDESPDEAFEKGRIFIKAKLRLLVDTVDEDGPGEGKYVHFRKCTACNVPYTTTSNGTQCPYCKSFRTEEDVPF